MPLFEFRCRDCGSRFEVLTSYEQSLGEMVCTTCRGTNVRKLIPLVARRGKSGDDFGDDFGGGDFGGADDFGDGGDDFGGEMSGGSCGCGGACSCNN
jgi:putative FmdB family regulatory protein